MKKLSYFWIIPVFLSAFFFTSILHAKPIKLTYSNFFPPTHIQSKLAQSWCDEVKKRTNGAVIVEYYPAQTLTKAKQVYDGVVSGMSDLGLCLFGYTRGRFPLMEAVDLPLGYKTGMVATIVANAVYEKFKPKELDDVKVMYLHAHGPGLLYTKEKPVHVMDDLKGIKIRSHGTTAKVVKALGGIPVTMPMPELYQSLQKGVVEGAIYPMEVNKGWRMADVVKYGTFDYPIANTSTFFVVMNKNKWAGLPDDVKSIITEINKIWTVKHGEAWDTSDAEGEEFLISKGGKLITLTEQEGKKWKTAIEPVIDGYIQKTEEKGLPAGAAVEFIKRFLEN